MIWIFWKTTFWSFLFVCLEVMMYLAMLCVSDVNGQWWISMSRGSVDRSPFTLCCLVIHVLKNGRSRFVLSQYLFSRNSDLDIDLVTWMRGVILCTSDVNGQWWISMSRGSVLVHRSRFRDERWTLNGESRCNDGLRNSFSRFIFNSLPMTSYTLVFIRTRKKLLRLSCS